MYQQLELTMTFGKLDRRLITWSAAALMLAACSSKDKTADQGRDIQLAPAPAAQPALNDAPSATAPAPATVPAPAPTTARAPVPRREPRRVLVAIPHAPEQRPDYPPYPSPDPVVPAPTPIPTPVPTSGIVAVGALLSVAPSTRICTNTHKVGDRFTATIQQPVTGTNGATIPQGSTASMRVTESARSENSKNNIVLSFAIESIQIGYDNYPVAGTVTQIAALDKVRAQSTTKQAEKVGAGAAIGAIAGQLLGKNTKGTVIGAAVGAAAGGAVAAGTADYDGCVPVGTPMNVVLDQPIRVKLK
jgi:hypothetical protein